MSEIWGIPSPTNRWSKNHFGRIRNIAVILMTCIFGMKHDIHDRTSALESTRSPLAYIISQCHERSSINGLKFDRHFYPHRKFCILIHCQPSHTDRRSANGTQPNFAKRKDVNGADASRIRWRPICLLYTSPSPRD